jgi:methionine synthase II (cobalamin-independent)
MPQDGKVLLVGSVARREDGWGVEDVLRNCARVLGPRAAMLPDGEIGPRQTWIVYLARGTYLPHPDIELRHPTPEEADDPTWVPKDYDDQFLFSVRDGVEQLRFDALGYAEEAERSYATFRRLRDEGAILPGVRFMVALPMLESGTRRFFDRPRDLELVWDGYAEALRREIADIVAAIPHEDLAIQWDMVAETYAVEGQMMRFDSAGFERLPVDPWERYRLAIRTCSQEVPEDVWLGLHICYGSLGQKQGESTDSAHVTTIEDLSTSVAMFNAAAEAAGRRLDFVHMSVPLSRGFDERYYAPLANLRLGDAHLYLGLIHLHDGVDGAVRRAELARRHVPRFGVATECGWGRRPPSQSIEDLLELERAVADALAAG